MCSAGGTVGFQINKTVQLLQAPPRNPVFVGFALTRHPHSKIRRMPTHRRYARVLLTACYGASSNPSNNRPYLFKSHGSATDGGLVAPGFCEWRSEGVTKTFVMVHGQFSVRCCTLHNKFPYYGPLVALCLTGAGFTILSENGCQ